MIENILCSFRQEQGHNEYWIYDYDFFGTEVGRWWARTFRMTFITFFNLVVVFGIFCDTSLVDVLSFCHEVLNLRAVGFHHGNSLSVTI